LASLRVFDRFHGGDPDPADPDRDHRRRVHNGGGSGLGLAITAAILEAHNGRIELHTAPRRGTTFRVLLPLA
jgi:two-component system OmpR family sensor kinase